MRIASKSCEKWADALVTPKYIIIQMRGKRKSLGSTIRKDCLRQSRSTATKICRKDL